MCEKDNKKCFLAKKANVKGDSSCSWAEIGVTLDAWPMIGNPGLVCVERPETFYDIACLAYKQGIFDAPEGYAKLVKIDGLKNASTAAPRSSEPVASFKAMLESTEKVAKDLAAHKSEVDVSHLSQGGALLSGQVQQGFERGIGCIEQEVVDDDYWLRKSKEELGSIIDEYKNRAILAEEKNAALDIADLAKDKRIDVLEASVDSLKKGACLS